ncbi:hypothetical protein CYY_001117 [Polysphondylium violaceum]|uniref:Leucine-rich repeat-containing protein n=1 Tax=Polysphondylium violaceum TaxID=133409 RepID=A0A8J4Q9R8_9MYCE|nr:hypothetical protein CYY_001117 [Polysphondylium violaceum]
MVTTTTTTDTNSSIVESLLELADAECLEDIVNLDLNNQPNCSQYFYLFSQLVNLKSLLLSDNFLQEMPPLSLLTQLEELSWRNVQVMNRDKSNLLNQLQKLKIKHLILLDSKENDFKDAFIFSIKTLETLNFKRVTDQNRKDIKDRLLQQKGISPPTTPIKSNNISPTATPINTPSPTIKNRGLALKPSTPTTPSSIPRNQATLPTSTTKKTPISPTLVKYTTPIKSTIATPSRPTTMKSPPLRSTTTSPTTTPRPTTTAIITKPLASPTPLSSKAPIKKQVNFDMNKNEQQSPTIQPQEQQQQDKIIGAIKLLIDTLDVNQLKEINGFINKKMG